MSNCGWLNQELRATKGKQRQVTLADPRVRDMLRRSLDETQEVIYRRFPEIKEEDRREREQRQEARKHHQTNP